MISSKFNQAGFTIPELVTVMIIAPLLASLIIFYGFNFWRTGALQQADNETLVTRLNAGDYVRENIGESSGLIIQNSLEDSNALNPDPAQPSGTYWIPIHAVSNTNYPVGTDNTTTPLLYFQKFSTDSSRNIIYDDVIPYEDEFVLYLNGSTKQLLARSIANPLAPGNQLKTTCPPEIAGQDCPADKVVAEEVESVDVRYFSRNGTVIDYESSTEIDPPYNFNGPDFPLAEVVELKINLATKAYFQNSTSTYNSSIIRISLRNS